jgi:signal transduction histidine kinase
MLLALHAAVAWGLSDLWSRAFLLAHMGLFLLWQPVWRGEGHVESQHAALILVIGVVLVAFANWWLTAIWLAVLFGLIGGNVPGIRERRHRLASLLAALYLLAMLLVWIVPQLFAVRVTADMVLVMAVRYGLLALPVTILFLRLEGSRSQTPHAVDLFYSVTLFLLVVALVLGSFAIKEIARTEYPAALAATLFGMAVLLVALSWLWDPHGGFSGIGQLLSRYLLSVGLPFERWMQALANRAEQDVAPDRFIAEAALDMLELPWVAGVQWRTRSNEGESGARSRFNAEYTHRELSLTIHTRWAISAALVLHLKLLTRLLGYFYEAKRREQLQRQNAYTQAIHETGARLTHDVKNLLQSLKSLCAAAEAAEEDRAAELQALMKRQLPQITQRLQATLDKLKAPGPEEQSTFADAAAWWEALRARYARSGVEFTAEEVGPGGKVPVDLFDSVADNLVQNALNKGRVESGLRITVGFTCTEFPRLLVSDTGSPVPRTVAQQLFDGPVPSHTGLGIGLYQAARQAGRLGYRLILTSNEAGSVRFELGKAG